MEPVLATSHMKLDKRRQEFSDRFDMMVAAFQSWDDVVPKAMAADWMFCGAALLGPATTVWWKRCVLSTLTMLHCDWPETVSLPSPSRL